MFRLRTNLAVIALAAVALPGAARAAYPRAGQDYFDSRAQVFITPVAGCATDVLLLDVVVQGPTLVRRTDPVFLPGQGAGFPHIDTEILSMQLTSIGGPPVTIREDPDRASLGGVTAQEEGTDFAADSSFDVFVEVDIGFLPGMTFENIEPVHMQSVIYSLPPHAMPYLPPPGTCIPLKIEGGPDVPVLWLVHADHYPDTKRECFSVTANGVINSVPPYYPSYFSAMGEAQFVRGIKPPDSDVIDVELVALELHGMMQDPFRGPGPMSGSEPRQTGSPGRLTGVPNGDAWHVDSFFDIFYTIDFADQSQSYAGRVEGTYGPDGGALQLTTPALSGSGETVMEQLSFNFSKIDCALPYPRP